MKFGNALLPTFIAVCDDSGICDDVNIYSVDISYRLQEAVNSRDEDDIVLSVPYTVAEAEEEGGIRLWVN